MRLVGEVTDWVVKNPECIDPRLRVFWGGTGSGFGDWILEKRKVLLLFSDIAFWSCLFIIS